MRQHPMLFSKPMIEALLAGRKTQTRRVLKKPTWAQDKGWPEQIMNEQDLDGTLNWYDRKTGCAAKLPMPQTGDLIWVKETWRPREGYSNWDLLVDYAANSETRHLPDDIAVGDWRFPKAAKRGNVSPLFMPKWASRMTLRVTDVRIEPVQAISDNDAKAEGIEQIRQEQGVPIWRNYVSDASLLTNGGFLMPTASFHSLWNSINGPDAWNENPWVVAYSFEVLNDNVLQVAA